MNDRQPVTAAGKELMQVFRNGEDEIAQLRAAVVELWEALEDQIPDPYVNPAGAHSHTADNVATLAKWEHLGNVAYPRELGGRGQAE